MKYSDLISFCTLISIITDDDDKMADLHILPDGDIARTLEKILGSIKHRTDFDAKLYITKLVGYEEYKEPDKRKLN